MILFEALLLLFTAAATISLTAGYAIEGMTALPVVYPGAGLIWWAAGRKFGGFIIPAGFFLFTGGAVGGVLAGLNFYLMLVGMVTALGVWDLLRFNQRISRVDASSDTEVLMTRHALKLGSVLGLGASLSLVAANLDVRLGFWAIVGIAVILLMSLHRAINHLNNARKGV